MSAAQEVAQALVLRDGALAMEPRLVPALEPGWARVRMLWAGVCSTDLHLIRGYKGFRGVLGHEFVGEVERCDAAPEWVGRRVVGAINVGCGACAWCAREGDGRHCAQRRVLGILGLDGCFTARFMLPLANLVPVPEHLDSERAVFAEPVAACVRAADALGSDARHVAVLGDGKLGLLQGAVLAARGHRVTHVGRHLRKLALAEPWARACVLDADLGDSARFPVVVEATGSPEGFARASALVEPEGVVVLKSTFHGLAPVDLSALVVREVTVIGSRCGPIDVAVELLASGALDPAPLIDAIYPLPQAVEALEHAGRRGTLKVLLRG